MRNTKFILILIIVTYFVTRFYNLTVIPIFNDESTYIRYGLHQFNEVDHKPYSLLIGKEPLMPYLYAALGTIINDLLIGARAISVFFGFLTLLGLFFTVKTIADNKAGLVVGLIYVFSPYALFFDRLAVMDNAVNTVTIWTLYFTFKILTNPQKRFFLILGFAMGIGLWIKTSAIFYVLLPVLVIMHKAYGIWKKDNNSPQPTQLILKLSISLLTMFFLILPLISNEFYAIHWQLLSQYIYPVYSIFSFPVTLWIDNLLRVFFWLLFYLSPFFILIIAFTVIRFRKKPKIFPVYLWFFLPFIYEILFAKMYTSRHALNLTIPLYILAAYFILKIGKVNKLFAFVMIILIVGWGTFYGSYLLNYPIGYSKLHLSYAKTDLLQYTKGFPSGYGVKEAIDYLSEKMKIKPIVVVIHNDHGNPEDAVVAYLSYKKNCEIILIHDGSDISELINGSKKPVYFVSRGEYNMGLDKYFANKKTFAKPYDSEYVGVYLLKPERN